jgi:hypothetical protein
MTDLAHAVQFLQAAYTILLGLAFGEAFKQCARWRPTYSMGSPSLATRVLIYDFPFYHPMSRYFYTTYLQDPKARLAPVAGSVMFDGMCFLTMSACFFVLSRSLSPAHWFSLLVVDSAWIGIASPSRSR